MPAKKKPAPVSKDSPEAITFPSEQAHRAYLTAQSIIKDALERMQAGEKVTTLGTALLGSPLTRENLSALPPEIWQLTTLTELDLSQNELTELPKEIGQLTALTKLELQHNLLTALPNEIGNLKALTVLDLSSNQLTTLPPRFWQLTALRQLSLSDNQLRALPPEIGELSALTVLFLYENALTALPQEIGKLAQLRVLYLNGNPLTELPATIGQLTALQIMDGQRLALNSLPREIGSLHELEKLMLNDNQLQSLPTEFGQLTALTLLDLSNNQLTALPPTMKDLKNLEVLHLHGNDSLGLPPEVLGKAWDEAGSIHVEMKHPREILEYYFTQRGKDMEPPDGHEQTALRVSADQVGAVDGLQRGSLVAVLCDIYCARKTEMPQTVTVEAPWGDGKSTLMALLIKRMKENYAKTTEESVRARIVEFNPWRYQTAEGLWSGFLAEFTAQMQEGMGFWEKVKMHWRYGKEMHGKYKMWLVWLPLLFTVAIYSMRHCMLAADAAAWAVFFLHVLAWAPLLLVALKLALVFWRPVRTFTAEMKTYFKKPDYAAGRDASERLHVEFRAWVRATVKPGERVFVFIDDLDRCPGPRAAELLEWLQLLLSGKGNREEGWKLPLVLVAGLDREKVAAAVAIKHQEVMRLLSQGKEPKEQAEEAIAWGYEYLEKFIDLPVRVPPGSEELLEGYLELLAPGAFEAEKTERKKAELRRQERLANMPRTMVKNALPSLDEPEVKPVKEPLPEAPAKDRSEAPLKDLEDPRIPDFLRSAAILLRHSPRRMKHFLNLLRLRWALRQKLGRDRMTLEMTARLVLLEVARPTLFRALADNRKLRELVFYQEAEGEPSEFRTDGPWKQQRLEWLFAADRDWLAEHGQAVLVEDWEDLRMRAQDKFYPGQPPEIETTPPMNLQAFNALLDGTRYQG